MACNCGGTKVKKTAPKQLPKRVAPSTGRVNSVRTIIRRPAR